MIQRLSSAKCCGVNVESIFQERTRFLKLYSVRASLPSVATALKAWHAFATGVLGVRSASTLPPMSEDHVCTFASVFRSPKTAANYTCVYLKVSTKWHGPEIKQIVTGIRKRIFRFTGGPSRVESLLTSALIHKVVSTADALRIQNGLQELCVLAWWFLHRVTKVFLCRLGTSLTVLNSKLYIIRVFGSKNLSFTYVCVDVKIDPLVLTCRGLVCVRSSVHTCVHHTVWDHFLHDTQRISHFLFTT